MNNICVFLINLKRSKDRLSQMKIKFQQRKISWRLLEAVDGYELSKSQIEFIHSQPKSGSGHYYAKSHVLMRIGAAGCTLSHFEAYRIMVNENIERAIIVEDDSIFFDRLDDILQAVDKIKDNWHIICLINNGNSPVRINKFHEEQIGKNIFCSKSMSWIDGSAQYIIRKNYAEGILKAVKKLSLPIDLLLYEHPFNIRLSHSIYSYDESGKTYMTAGKVDKSFQSTINIAEEKKSNPQKKTKPYKKYKAIVYPFLKKHLNVLDFIKFFPQKDIADYNIYDSKTMHRVKRMMLLIQSIDWPATLKYFVKKL